MPPAGPSSEVEAVRFNAEGLATVAFSVQGMMCEDSCAKSVREILASQPGVQDVEVDYDAKTATCAVDEAQFDPTTAIAALADKDFEAAKQP